MAVMKHSAKITLYSSYFDENDRLSPKSILNLFQDVAGVNGDEIGVGYLSLLEKNLYWILTRVKFDIIKMPIPNQTVYVQTWPHEKGRIDFDRDFKIANEENETMIIGTSKWCVIDTETRTLQRTNNVNYIGEICPDKNYEDKFLKITIPDETPVHKFTHSVRFSDLDHNHHMNNTNYANLVTNATENQIFNHFEINYLSECKLDDKIEVSTIKTESAIYIIGKNGDKLAFTTLIK